MATAKVLRQSYPGRAPGIVPTNLSLDRDAAVLLHELAPTSKGHGKFVSRLIFEFAARKGRRGKAAGVLGEDEGFATGF